MAVLPAQQLVGADNGVVDSAVADKSAQSTLQIRLQIEGRCKWTSLIADLRFHTPNVFECRTIDGTSANRYCISNFEIAALVIVVVKLI